MLRYAAAAGAGLAAVLVSVPPVAGWSYPAHDLRIALETLQAVLTCAAAALLFHRWRDTGSRPAFLLAAALILLTAGHLATWTLPLSAPTRSWTSASGVLVLLRPLGIGLVALAAWIPDRGKLRPLPTLLAITAALVLILGVVVLAARAGWLPPSGLVADSGSALGVEAHPAWRTLGLTSASFAVVGAIGLWRRNVAAPTGFAVWLAIAVTLLAAAQLQVALVPAPFTDRLHAVDLSRLGATLLLFLAAAHEIPDYARRATVRRLGAERRRIAQDLHDGVAQEVAFIGREVRLLAADRDGADPSLDAIAAAAVRAQEEARFALASLTPSPDAPFRERLGAITGDVARRQGAEISIGGSGEPDLPGATADTLLRVAREAVTNAVRHGRATCVELDLSCASGLRLRITDDGCGFEADEHPPGFGLVSMRERVTALGGSLEVRSSPGSGTEVEVRL